MRARRVSQLLLLLLAAATAACALAAPPPHAAGPTCASVHALRPHLTPPPQQQQPPAVHCVQLSDAIVLQYALVPASLRSAAPSGAAAGNASTASGGTTVLFAVTAHLPSDAAFLGLGLSELGSMKGADMAILLRAPSSNSVNGSTSSSTSPAAGRAEALVDAATAPGWRLIDAFAPGFVQPVEDASQDLRLLSLATAPAANGQRLTAAWSRPLVPCDAAQDLALAPGMPVHFLWAHGSGGGLAYHGPNNRGSTKVAFAAAQGGSGSAGGPDSHSHGHAGSQPQGSADTANTTANTTTLDLTFPVSIPAQETTYWVHYFKLPDDRKYHIVSYEAVSNSPLLHHGVAYACSPSDAAQVASLPSLGPVDRFREGMLCEQYMMLVTPSGSWEAPAVAGLPFGANSTRVVAVELHYNNPQLLTGQADKGSGIRIHFTPQLRPHDTGLITLTQMVLQLPPAEPTYPVNVSVCPSTCTRRLRQPLNLLEGFFHMHGTGKAAVARHFRAGRELQPLGQLHSYDYNYQGGNAIYAPDGMVLLPGDSVTLQCVFDTTTRTNVSEGGPGTADEMCFFWLTYWPAQRNFGLCHSFGNATGPSVAVCGSDVKMQPVFEAFKNATAMARMLADGSLVPFPGDPAVNATAFASVCTPAGAT